MIVYIQFVFTTMALRVISKALVSPKPDKDKEKRRKIQKAEHYKQYNPVKDFRSTMDSGINILIIEIRDKPVTDV